MFDAQTKYTAKIDMFELESTDLKKGDLVLAEFFVTRWIPKENSDTSGTGDGKSRYGRKREWRRWNVDFKLDALSLLYRGSTYYVEPQRADEKFSA